MLFICLNFIFIFLCSHLHSEDNSTSNKPFNPDPGGEKEELYNEYYYTKEYGLDNYYEEETIHQLLKRARDF